MILLLFSVVSRNYNSIILTPLFCVVVFPHKDIIRRKTPLGWLECEINTSSGVKSGKFGHQVNSDTHLTNSGNPDETAPYEPSHQVSTVCLVNLFLFQ